MCTFLLAVTAEGFLLGEVSMVSVLWKIVWNDSRYLQTVDGSIAWGYAWRALQSACPAHTRSEGWVHTFSWVGDTGVLYLVIFWGGTVEHCCSAAAPERSLLSYSMSRELDTRRVPSPGPLVFHKEHLCWKTCLIGGRKGTRIRNLNSRNIVVLWNLVKICSLEWMQLWSWAHSFRGWPYRFVFFCQMLGKTANFLANPNI